MSSSLTASIKIAVDAFGLDKIHKISASLDKTGGAVQRLNVGLRDEAKFAAQAQRAELSLAAARQKAAAAQLLSGKQAQAAQQRMLIAERRMQLAQQAAQVRMAGQKAAQARAAARAQAPAGASGGRGSSGSSGFAMPSLFKLWGYGYMLKHALQTVGGIVSGLMTPAIEFESAMAQVRIKGGFDAAQTAGLAASAMQMGRTSMFTPIESAQAQIALAASGLTPETITGAMPVVKKFALGADLSTEEASNALVGVAKQFDLELTQTNLSEVGGSLIKAANASLVSVRDLLQTLKYVGPLGELAGLDLAEVLSMASLVGDRGIRGSQSGTGTRNMLVSLAKPKGGRATAGMLHTLGITKQQQRTAMEDIDGFMLKIQKAMDRKRWTKQARVGFFASYFGQYGMTTAAVLAKASERHPISDTNRRMLSDVDKRSWMLREGAPEALESAYAVQAATPAARLKALGARWDVLKIDMGEKLMAYAMKSADVLTKVVEELDLALNQGKYDLIFERLGTSLVTFTNAATLIQPALELLAQALSYWSEDHADRVPAYARKPKLGEKGYAGVEKPWWMFDETPDSFTPGDTGHGIKADGSRPRQGPAYGVAAGMFDRAPVHITVAAEKGTHATISTLKRKDVELRTEGNVKQ
jgi:TP901 family phage tail tape measure protein